jgi:hypothetical protein
MQIDDDKYELNFKSKKSKTRTQNVQDVGSNKTLS